MTSSPALTRSSTARMATALVAALSVLFLLCGLFAITGLGKRSAVAADNASPAQRQTLVQADNTAGGQVLGNDGYHSKAVVTDADLSKFLDKQVQTGGQYVLYTAGRSLVEGPTDKPDAIVELTTGTIVALTQGYTNERGATCVNTPWAAGVWKAAGAVLWHRSLGQVVTLTHADVHSIPPGQHLICYTDTLS